MPGREGHRGEVKGQTLRGENCFADGNLGSSDPRTPPLPLCDIPSGCSFFTQVAVYGALDSHPFSPPRAVSGVVSMLAEPSSWRTGGCAGCCGVRFTVFVAHTPQVLVQFATPFAADTAMKALSGRNVGVCRLLIQWSNVPELSFKRSDDRNRDYTTLPLLQPLPVGLGVGLGMGGLALGGLAGLPGLGMQPLPPGMNALPQLPGPGTAAGATLAGAMMASAGTGAVLFVSGLDQERATAGALFTLFGLYGDVQMVKILYKKRDSALVQFADASQVLCPRPWDGTGGLVRCDQTGKPILLSRVQPPAPLGASAVGSRSDSARPTVRV